MVYDRLARRQWAERAHANEVSISHEGSILYSSCSMCAQVGFDVDTMSSEMSKELLLAAEQEYDRCGIGCVSSGP